LNKKERKGILLSGGLGSRLFPITKGLSKQLMPIYDKPMVYFPLSVLMLAGIRDIALITNPENIGLYKKVLEDGSQWGINLTYLSQPSPDGIAQAYILAEDFLKGSTSALILGDNLFYGDKLSDLLIKANNNEHGATIFGYRVSNPSEYGVIRYGENENIALEIQEKPAKPPSNYAVSGLYFFDNDVCEKAKNLKPSKRGELEITCLLNSYLRDHNLNVINMGRGYTWLDTGTHESLLDAGNFVRTIQKRQGLHIGSPDEISYQKGWIDKEQLIKRANLFDKTSYGKYLEQISLDF
tara:strand:- start:332 stop:1219 length:888 start_codon:yes stop_codon:yes gene_type:complete